MYVCLYVCLSVCMYVCMYLCSYVAMYLSIYLYIYYTCLLVESSFLIVKSRLPSGKLTQVGTTTFLIGKSTIN